MDLQFSLVDSIAIIFTSWWTRVRQRLPLIFEPEKTNCGQNIINTSVRLTRGRILDSSFSRSLKMIKTTLRPTG
jgi:hypothetical protein